MLYFAHTIESLASGKRLVEVECEKCKSRYFYELARQALGAAASPYLLFRASATDRSVAGAQRRLAKRLSTEADLVPCPKCHWINNDLIKGYRRGVWPYVGMPIYILLVTGVLFLIMSTDVGESARRAVQIWTIIFFMAPVGILGAKFLLRRSINPNAAFPRPPVVPPGTPPALVERRDSNGARVLVPVPNEDAQASRGRAIFRVGQIKFPEMCCVCLEEATTSYSSPFKINHRSGFPAPLCDKCSAGAKLKWWLVAPVIFLIVAGCCLLLPRLIPGIDPDGGLVIGAIVGLFASLYAVAILPDLLARPFGYGKVDRSRGVCWFSARNPTYTQMVIDLAAASDRKRRSFPAMTRMQAH